MVEVERSDACKLSSDSQSLLPSPKQLRFVFKIGSWWSQVGLSSLVQPRPSVEDRLGPNLPVPQLLPALQVIGGAGLDVDFTLESPQGVLLVSESRKADGVHT